MREGGGESRPSPRARARARPPSLSVSLTLSFSLSSSLSPPHRQQAPDVDAVQVGLDLGDARPGGQGGDKGDERARGRAKPGRRADKDGERAPKAAARVSDGVRRPPELDVVQGADAPVHAKAADAHGHPDGGGQGPPPRLLRPVLALGAVGAERAFDVVFGRVEILGFEAGHALEAGQGFPGFLGGRERER